jgi:phosphatidylserine decarboxylase
MKHKSIIVAEGFPFIVLSLVFTGFAAFFGVAWLTILLAALTIFIIAFFRNPQRHFQAAEKLVISPADGKVIKMEEVDVRGAMAGRFKKISIFMNVFNVHVNRAPYEGTIEKISYHPGKFVSA